MIRPSITVQSPHFVDYEEVKAVSNTILQNQCNLAKRDAKPSEAFIVDLSNGNYH